GRHRAAPGRAPGARRLRGHRRGRVGRAMPRGRDHAGVRPRSGHAHRRLRPGPADAARRRAAGRALHRVELRVLAQGTDRTGQGRLAGRPDEAPGPGQRRMHPAPRRPGTDPTRTDVLTYNPPAATSRWEKRARPAAEGATPVIAQAPAPPVAKTLERPVASSKTAGAEGARSAIPPPALQTLRQKDRGAPMPNCRPP